MRGAAAQGDEGAAAPADSARVSSKVKGPPGNRPLVERLRSLHLQMMEAVLGGEGLGAVAELAAAAAGGAVAIIVPRLGVSVVAPDVPAADLARIRKHVADRVEDRPTTVPDGMLALAPIQSGEDIIGAVVLLGTGRPVGTDSEDFLHVAAVTSLTEVAVEEAREQVEQNLRGSFLEDLRSRPDLEPRDVVRRAARLGCDLSRGVVVLCAELNTERPRHVVAMISEDFTGSLAQLMDGRLYALLPANGGDDAPERTLQTARTLATRLQRYGTVGLSSFYTDPAEFSRGMQEAELVLDVLRQTDAPIAEDIGTGTYRLLFRVLASHPGEVRSFYDDTVAPIVKYDDQYRTDLVGTLEAYLAQNCNMNATAATIYAHRHTVAYRLDRVKELTGLDPMQSEDRERLGLGLKAYRIIAPRLPK